MRRGPDRTARAVAGLVAGARRRTESVHGRYLARHRLRRGKHPGRFAPQRPLARHRGLRVRVHEGIPRRSRDHRSRGTAQFHGELRAGHQCVAARPARPKPGHLGGKSPQPHDGPRPRGEPGDGLFHQYHKYGSLPRGTVRRHARCQLSPLRGRRAGRRAQSIFQDRRHAPQQRQPPLRLRLVGSQSLRNRCEPRARKGPARTLARWAAPGKRRLAPVRFPRQAPDLRCSHRAPDADVDPAGDGRDRP